MLIGNILKVALAIILRAYADPASLPGYNPDLRFLDQIGFLMVWGTVLLFVDLIALVIIYERLGALVTNTIPGRIFISLAILLSFDQVFFYAGLNILSGVPLTAFYGGWIAEVGAAGFFSFMLTLYLRFVDTSVIRARPLGAVDVFDRLTYRHRYEKLVERIGRDALTGLKDRGPFDVRGSAMLQAALQSTLCEPDDDRHRPFQGHQRHARSFPGGQSDPGSGRHHHADEARGR